MNVDTPQEQSLSKVFDYHEGLISYLHTPKAAPSKNDNPVRVYEDPVVLYATGSV
ncbi:hypothetical protein ANO14919_004610 [Xylariales sp. No.14919]|nr:hypothetical protein ANO14919_004610 [Xylariales sp. No.14919]